MAVVEGIEPSISEATTRRINHSPIQPNLNFVCEISNSLIFSTLVQNRTGTAGLEDPCTLRYATRVYFKWRIWESNPSDILIASQASTPCRPIPQIYNKGQFCLCYYTSKNCPILDILI